MSKENKNFYEFEGIRFYPEQARLKTAQNEGGYTIRPKERDLLLMLVREPQSTVSYEKLRQEIWPEYKRLEEAMPTIRETKRALSVLLNDLVKGSKNIIKTDMGEGYRLEAEVNERIVGDLNAKDQSVDSLRFIESPSIAEKAYKPDEEPITKEESQTAEKSLSHTEVIEKPKTPSKGILGSHPFHVFIASTLYASLYVIAYVVEIAYQFDKFSGDVPLASVATFLWIWITCVAGFRINEKRVIRGEEHVVTITIAIFVGAALVLFSMMWLFLPGYPITEARFPTYPARAAYLKSIVYFLPLALIFLILPFNFVVSLEKELRNDRYGFVIDLLGTRWKVALKGAIFPRTWFLILVLTAFAGIGFYMKAHLLENLMPDKYRDLFMQAVEWRFALYFALAIECVAWYHLSLHNLVAQCRTEPGSIPMKTQK